MATCNFWITAQKTCGSKSFARIGTTLDRCDDHARLLRVDTRAFAQAHREAGLKSGGELLTRLGYKELA